VERGGDWSQTLPNGIRIEAVQHKMTVRLEQPLNADGLIRPTSENVLSQGHGAGAAIKKAGGKALHETLKDVLPKEAYGMPRGTTVVTDGGAIQGRESPVKIAHLVIPGRIKGSLDPAPLKHAFDMALARLDEAGVTTVEIPLKLPPWTAKQTIAAAQEAV